MANPLRIKVCGITSAADGREAALLGADAVGLNFYPPSPRYVEPSRVADILRELAPFVDAVGVFVGQRPEQAFEFVARLGRIRTLQLHGGGREPGDPSR